MNERTHFFIKIYISHFILERVMFLVRERWVGDGDRLLHIDPSSSDQCSTSFSSWFGLLNRGSLRAASPLSAAGSHFGILSLTDSNFNWVEPPGAPGYIIFLRPPAFAVLPLFYTGASLDWRLGRGSICYNRTLSGSTGPDPTWKKWQWRFALYFPKLQHYKSLTIRLFSFISRTLVEVGVLPFCRDAVGIFYTPSRMGRKIMGQVRENQLINLSYFEFWYKIDSRFNYYHKQISSQWEPIIWQRKSSNDPTKLFSEVPIA